MSTEDKESESQEVSDPRLLVNPAVGEPAYRREPIDTLLAPFRAFIERQSSGGVLLIVATLIALIWANSGYAESYEHFWHTDFGFTLAGSEFHFSLRHWINDGLMAVFFFIVGLEIKRELIAGELSTVRKAALPIAGAVGGMVLPALLYTVFNFGTETAGGWGVPMATDIAFAIGILSLFGDRVPVSLKVFLTALAIVDDLGAVLVIALFYSGDIILYDLYIGLGFLAVLFGCNLAGIRTPLVYGIIGLFGMWTAFLLSGVHPTVAGVLAAFTIPARPRMNTAAFLQQTVPLLVEIEKNHTPGDSKSDSPILNPKQLSNLFDLNAAVDNTTTPLVRLQRVLTPWMTFFIMPLFALANAGVHLSGENTSDLVSPVSLGIIFGLLFGKQLGIFAACWLAIRLGVASLPANVSWFSLYAVSILGGIGFTMSLFIANLAFSAGGEYLAPAKFAILIGSLASGLMGTVFLMRLPKRKMTEEEAYYDH